MYAVLFLSHFILAIVIEQIHVLFIGFVYFEQKQISSRL